MFLRAFLLFNLIALNAFAFCEPLNQNNPDNQNPICQQKNALFNESLEILETSQIGQLALAQIHSPELQILMALENDVHPSLPNLSENGIITFVPATEPDQKNFMLIPNILYYFDEDGKHPFEPTALFYASILVHELLHFHDRSIGAQEIAFAKEWAASTGGLAFLISFKLAPWTAYIAEARAFTVQCNFHAEIKNWNAMGMEHFYRKNSTLFQNPSDCNSNPEFLRKFLAEKLAPYHFAEKVTAESLAQVAVSGILSSYELPSYRSMYENFISYFDKLAGN